MLLCLPQAAEAPTTLLGMCWGSYPGPGQDPEQDFDNPCWVSSNSW